MLGRGAVTAVDQIEHCIQTIKAQRVEWLAERPKVPKPEDAEEFTRALRAAWRWYRDQRDRLEKAKAALQALIDDCELSMSETESVASLMKEISEKQRLAEQYADVEA